MRETSRAKQAYAEYVALGPNRSLEKLATQFKSAAKAPSRHLSTLKGWSSAFGWQARLDELAERAKAEAEEAEAQRMHEALFTGAALPYIRVEMLKKIAADLYAELTADDEGNRRWLPDVKQIGAERVDIERFNSSEYERFFDALDDLAKETGGRQTKHEVSGPGGGPIPIRTVTVDIPLEEDIS